MLHEKISLHYLKLFSMIDLIKEIICCHFLLVGTLLLLCSFKYLKAKEHLALESEDSNYNITFFIIYRLVT
jgi:hypothetical protein